MTENELKKKGFSWRTYVDLTVVVLFHGRIVGHVDMSDHGIVERGADAWLVSVKEPKNRFVGSFANRHGAICAIADEVLR